MTVFASIGLGMASPYGVLAIWPRLVRFLPRPGAWMQVLEKGMAFILAATCLYFLALLSAPSPAADAGRPVGRGGRGHPVRPGSAPVPERRPALRHESGGRGRGRGRTGLRPGLCPAGRSAVGDLFARSLRRPPWDGENLVLDFTADWCPTCKLLERTVLTPARLTQWGERHKTVFMKVDLTRQTPPAMGRCCGRLAASPSRWPPFSRPATGRNPRSFCATCSRPASSSRPWPRPSATRPPPARATARRPPHSRFLKPTALPYPRAS